MGKSKNPTKIKRFNKTQNKQNVLKLGLHFQSGNNLQPAALVDSILTDGWYVYSYKKPKDKNNSNYLYLDNPPLSGLKVYLSSYHFPSVGPKVVEKICDERKRKQTNARTNERTNKRTKD